MTIETRELNEQLLKGRKEVLEVALQLSRFGSHQIILESNSKRHQFNLVIKEVMQELWTCDHGKVKLQIAPRHKEANGWFI